MLVLFPDTNLLMQCRGLTELPWRELPGVEGHVRIVLGRTVVREVDRFKSDGKGRRSKRARTLSSGLFKELLDARDHPVILRESAPRVDVVIADVKLDPSVTPDLDLSHADDRIVAEAVAYSNDVMFFSHDTIALHTAAAQGIKCQRIPDEWLSDPEPEPRQKQIEELERRVRLLEGGSPTIEIRLTTESVTIHTVKHAALPENLIKELIEGVKLRHPVQLDFSNPRKAGDLRTVAHFRLPPVTEIEEYQGRAYPAWILSVEQGLRALPGRLSAETRCAEITIEIENSGGAPAREAQLEFWLSEGLVFLHPIDEASNRLKVRALPNPPSPPAAKDLRDPLRSLRSPPFVAHTSPFPDHEPRRDQHDFYYKPVPKDADGRHILECAVFRHRVEPESFDFLIFAEEDVNGGKITCRVTASNLAEPAVAEFPIKIEYADREAAQTARDMAARIGRRSTT